MTQPAARPFWFALIPAAFVLLWASSFQVTLVMLRYGEPFTTLAIRSVLTVAVGLGVGFAVRASWPRSWREAVHIAVAGILLQSLYLGCMVNALDQRVPQGTAALIAGMQPLLTALAAVPLLGERIVRRQWFGLMLGLVGVALVVSDRVSGNAPLLGFLLIAPSPFLITAATLYQKRFCPGMNTWTGIVIQHGAAGLCNLAFAAAFETMIVQPSWQYIAGVLFMCLAISVGAVNLYFFMLRRGEASRVSSLFYLTPGVTAVLAWLTFGERLTADAIIGFSIAALGVALVTRGKPGA
jgi:drug/metabolite transporter (DMT)-like permease